MHGSDDNDYDDNADSDTFKWSDIIYIRCEFYEIWRRKSSYSIKVLSWIVFRHNYSLYSYDGDEDDGDDDDDDDDDDDSSNSNDSFSYDRVHVSTDYQPIIGVVVVPCTCLSCIITTYVTPTFTLLDHLRLPFLRDYPHF